MEILLSKGRNRTPKGMTISCLLIAVYKSGSEFIEKRCFQKTLLNFGIQFKI